MGRNIKVEHINNYQKSMTFLELSYKKHFEHIIGQNISKTSATASYAEDNKALTKMFLSRKKINVAKGKIFHKDNINKAYKFIKEIGYPIVIKPVDGAHGDLVFIGLKNKKDCDRAIKKIFEKKKFILVEKEFKGKEFRFIASRDKVFAVTNRDPANIVGDGVHSIKELVKIKNKDSKRGEDSGSPLVKIKIDDITKQKLNEQNMEVDYVPTKMEKIYLRKESNISTGGDSIDVTDLVHPELKKIVVETVKAIPGLAYAGVDLMTNKDISKKPTKNSYIIIEMNASPGIDIHHFPYKGKSRNVAKGIVNILFPETKK
ncbi:MAG: glutamate ligase [Candidatus Pacebacteria bacterium]|nr:glutamate ligase [Candidatus Paceibacterota bacterium]